MKRRLAILATHPIQYQTPWYQALSNHPDIDITVYYCHRATPKEHAAAGFGIEFDWDIPLLEGYKYHFLKNVASTPALRGFYGLDVPEIADIIHRERFDAVLVSGWTYKGAWQTFRACWRTKTPVMVRGDSNLKTHRSLIKRILKYPFYRWFLSRMDVGLAVGKWSHDYFQHYGLSSDRIFYVPHIVDEARFLTETTQQDHTRANLRAQWNILPDSVVYLFCGKLNGQKRPLDFVQAVGLAHQQNSAIIGLVVGDGLLRQECEALSKADDIPIIFKGFMNQTDLPSAYAVSDVLVLCSTSETWGLVVNEAMLSRIPALVNDKVGCAPDLIELGMTGDIFPMGNVHQLATLIVRYAEDPSRLRVMGTRARDKVQSEYSIDNAVYGILQALERVSKR